MEVYTIGFTQTSAAAFFGKLKQAGIRRLVDVRLNNVSQLAGFAKRDDLQYFLAEICGAEYIHEPRLAPTQDILDAYKKAKGSWDVYAMSFLQLLADRQVETAIQEREQRALARVNPGRKSRKKSSRPKSTRTNRTPPAPRAVRPAAKRRRR